MTMHRREFLETAAMAAGGLLASTVPIGAGTGAAGVLYVATPGDPQLPRVRRRSAILVYDIDHDHRFVRRIPTFAVPAGEAPENVKGIAASAKTRRVYVTTHKRLACFDLVTDRMVWSREYAGRLRPDGDLARRQAALRAVVRGTALARR